MGALHECVHFYPDPQSLRAPRQRVNLFEDKLSRELVESLAHSRGFQLSEDQGNALQYVNIFPKPVLVIHALAGTGKSTVAGLIMEAYMRQMPHGEAVVILVPSRSLRDEHAMRADTAWGRLLDANNPVLAGGTEPAQREDACTRILWLGRQADDNIAQEWGTQVFHMTQKALKEPLQALEVRRPSHA